MSKSFDVVLYHDNCWDGSTAAYIASLYNTSAELMPIQYGYDFEKVSKLIENKKVLVVDFSFKSFEVTYLIDKCLDLLIIDHHKTAVDELVANLSSDVLAEHTILDIGKSGAGLVFDYYKSDLMYKSATSLTFNHIHFNNLKWLVEKVQDRDLWVKDSEDFEVFSAFMNLYEKNPKSVGVIVYGYDKSDILTRGSSVLAFKNRLCYDHIKHVRFTLVKSASGDVKYPAVIFMCSCSMIVSDICDKLLQSYKNDATMCGIKVAVSVIYLNPGTVLYQLRSIGDADVGYVAKSYGGGGHKNSAGVTDSESKINWYDSSLGSYKVSFELPKDNDSEPI